MSYHRNIICGDSDVIINELIEKLCALGAKNIIVHPIGAPEGVDYQQTNIEFYKSLVPYCEKFGIKVATENMWQNNPSSGAITDSTCSRAWEFNKYIDAVNSEWITGCLDLGHVSLVTKKIPEFIKEMGKERISALHVHDTNLKEIP